MKSNEDLLSGLNHLKTCYRKVLAIVPNFARDLMDWKPEMGERDQWMEKAREIDYALRPRMAEWRGNPNGYETETNRRIRQSADELIALMLQVKMANDRMEESMAHQKDIIRSKLLNLKGQRKAISCYARS